MGKKKEVRVDEKINNLEVAIEESANSALIMQNKKHKRKVVIISLIIVILIAIISVTLYVLNNPRLIFNAAINNMFNTLENNVENVENSYINNSGTINEDYMDSISSFNDLTISEDNILPILTGVKEAFLAATSGEKITGNNITIKINGQDVETNRVSLVIDEANNVEFYNKIINNLKNNSSFLTACSTLTGYTADNVINSLEEFTTVQYTEPLTISFYTTGLTRDFVKLEVSREINNITNVLNITKLSDDSYEYKIVKDNISLTGNITSKDSDIIIDFIEYEDEEIINEGTLTVQRQYK